MIEGDEIDHEGSRLATWWCKSATSHVIRKGDSPNKGKKMNKYLTTMSHEGLRGTLMAVNKDKSQAIMMNWNNSFDGQCKWGHLYLVKENILLGENTYPEVIREVRMIPKDFTAVF